MTTAMLTRVAVAAILTTACVEYDDTLGDPRVGEGPPPSESTRKLDLLFVVDNSGSMGEEQASLAANFHSLMDQLDSLPGGRPDVQIGVVSSNVGALGNPITPCIGDGDDGTLQSAARRPDCTPPDGSFLYDHQNADGTRDTNFAGELGDAFACIAELGTQGCGFEQHFEAMRRALGGLNPTNAGFVRDDAYLAVVFIADEDDCSAFSPDLFSVDAAEALGPTTSFRCIEYGVVCDGAPVLREPAAYEACEPNEASLYVMPVGDYVAFLRALKSSPAAVIPSAIVGDPAPFVVGLDADDRPQLEPSCISEAGEATPGIRFRALVESFPSNAFTSICNPDLSSALALVGGGVRAALDGVDEPPQVSHGCTVSRTTASLNWLLIAGLMLFAARRRTRHDR